jgi:hypothetical protein
VAFTIVCPAQLRPASGPDANGTVGTEVRAFYAEVMMERTVAETAKPNVRRRSGVDGTPGRQGTTVL